MAQLIIVINKIIFYYLKINKSTYKSDDFNPLGNSILESTWWQKIIFRIRYNFWF